MKKFILLSIASIFSAMVHAQHETQEAKLKSAISMEEKKDVVDKTAIAADKKMLKKIKIN